MNRSPTVVLFGDYDYSYPRERTFRDGLRHVGAEVIECRLAEEESLVGVQQLLLLFPAMARLALKYRSLTREVDPDAIIVTRNDHLLLPVAAAISSAPLFFDTFDSPYHYARLNDRSLLRQTALFTIEFTTLQIPHRLIGLTVPLAELRAETFGLSMDRFDIVPVGADEDCFYPVEPTAEREEFTVLYWGMFHPHHGTPTIAEAAVELADQTDIHFEFVGEGVDKDAVVDRVEAASLSTVTFHGRLPYDELRDAVASADVCIGTVSGEDMALRSLMNRVCESLAMEKPVITVESPATDRFESGVHVLKVPPEDPVALANTIDRLADDPKLESRLIEQGNRYFENNLSKRAVGEQLLKIIQPHA